MSLTLYCLYTYVITTGKSPPFSTLSFSLTLTQPLSLSLSSENKALIVPSVRFIYKTFLSMLMKNSIVQHYTFKNKYIYSFCCCYFYFYVISFSLSLTPSLCSFILFFFVTVTISYGSLNVIAS